MNRDLAEIISVMSRVRGRDISSYDEPFLMQAVEKRLAAKGLDSSAAYATYLRDNASEMEDFFYSLNIHYSEFFRNYLAFALLEKTVIPRLVEEKEKAGQAEIRIWSAGCSAGQEAYSLAILLDEIIAERGSRISFRIFATDISETDLEKARRGRYNSKALQNVRLKHIQAYFTQSDDTYTITPKLQDRIDFSVYDLRDEQSVCPQASIYGDFNLIACSNLLFYYRPDIRRVILDKMWRCLSQNGLLMTSEAEKAIVEQARGFRAIATPAVVFQRVKRAGDR